MGGLHFSLKVQRLDVALRHASSVSAILCVFVNPQKRLDDILRLDVSDTERLRVNAVPVTLIAVHPMMQPDLALALTPRRKHSKVTAPQQENPRLVQSRGEMSRCRVRGQDEA